MTDKVHETLKNRVSQYVEQGEPSDSAKFGACDNYIISLAELGERYPFIEFTFDMMTEDLVCVRLYDKKESKEYGL